MQMLSSAVLDGAIAAIQSAAAITYAKQTEARSTKVAIDTTSRFDVT